MVKQHPNYAYSKLNPETSKQCNFKSVGFECTGTYNIKPAFTDSPVCLLKAVDCTSSVLRNTYCFLDDIFIDIKISKSDHFLTVHSYLK